MRFFSSIYRRGGAAATLALAVAWAAIGSGCGREPVTRAGPEYHAEQTAVARRTVYFAIHPLHNPRKLVECYQPLMTRLSERVPGVTFEVEASRDYQEFERKIATREPEIVLPNPWQTLEAMKVGYRVIAMAGEPQDFKGLIIVRRDSGIERVEDLRGKSIAYPSRTALAACVMPQWFLHERGIDVNREVANRYVGSQESAIMNAFLHETAAGVTWPPPWRAFVTEHPVEAAQLRVAWETESLVNNSVMVRNDVDPAVAERVRRELVELGNSEEGRAILRAIDAARFLPAGDSDYERVREFVVRFEAQVRPVKGGAP